MRLFRKIVTWAFIVWNLMAALFVAGYAFEDPGGWKGAGLVAVWVVPTAILTWWFLRLGERVATPAFLLTGTVCLVNLSVAIWPRQVGEWMDQNGPATAIVTLCAIFILATVALNYPGIAGWNLLLLGTIPEFSVLIARSMEGRVPGGSATDYICLPAIIVSLVLVSAEILEQHEAPTRRRMVT